MKNTFLLEKIRPDRMPTLAIGIICKDILIAKEKMYSSSKLYFGGSHSL